MDIRRQIGQNVRRLRLAKPLSQEKLAFEAEIDRTWISGIERGVANPSAQMLEKIANVLKVPVWTLLAPHEGAGERPKNLPRGRNVHHQGRKMTTRQKN